MGKIDPLSWVLVTGELEDGSNRAIYLDGRIEVLPVELSTNEEIASHCGVTGARRWGGPPLSLDAVQRLSEQNSRRVRPLSNNLKDALAGASARMTHLLDVWVDEPLDAVGFTRRARRWSHGDTRVKGLVEVREQTAARLTEGAIFFTLEFGIWIRAFAEHVAPGKKPSPRLLDAAPWVGRVAELLVPSQQQFWIVNDRGVYVSGWPEPTPLNDPTPNDPVPTLLRESVGPALAAVSDIDDAARQIERWEASGLRTCFVWTAFDPVEVLRSLNSEGRDSGSRDS